MKRIDVSHLMFFLVGMVGVSFSSISLDFKMICFSILIGSAMIAGTISEK